MATYIIRVGATGPVKIGRAVNVRARRKELQTAHYEDLRILRVIHADVERALHKRFSGLRIRGEWFHYDDAMLSIEVVEAALEPEEGFETEVAEYQRILENGTSNSETALDIPPSPEPEFEVGAGTHSETEVLAVPPGSGTGTDVTSIPAPAAANTSDDLTPPDFMVRVRA